MSTQKFGAVEWDAVKFGKNAGYDDENKTEFLRLKSGDNRIRIITPPFQYSVWRFKPTGDVVPEGGNKFGERVMSSLFHGADPLTEDPWNMKFPQRRWLTGVIDRTTGSYKVLDMGSSIFEKVQLLHRKRGDVQTYDITIIKNPQNPPASYYSVIHEDKEPLSAADLELKEQVDLEDLKRRVSAPTYDEVKARVAKILEKYNLVIPKTTTTTTSGTIVASQDSVEDDTDFPSADL